MSENTKKDQMWIELITTVLVILFYWISMQPDWKLQMYLRMVKERFLQELPAKAHGLSLEHRLIIQKFRQEISEWEHRNASPGQ